jgi:hypothetical protein
MASIESRIDAFIASNELDKEIKDPLCALITEAMGDLFKHVFSQPVPADTETGKAKKVLKADKVEDPTSCETQEELRNCTTGVLNQFCKDNGLKVGGNKKEIMDRVWRHMQGESSDDDKSTRNKPKASKKVPEKHVCAGNNIAGVPCGSSGTEEFDGCYFCWRHISDAQKFIDAKKPKAAASSNAPESVAKPKAKAPKASPAQPKKGKKKETPKEELVTEDEDTEQQETDEEA